MPVNIDDKLKMFQNLITDKIHSENEDKISKLSKIYEQELTSSQNKIHLQAVRILNEAEITARAEEKNQLQKAVAERNKQILFARKQYMDELFRMLRETVDHMSDEKKRQYIKASILKAEKMFGHEDDLILKTENEEYELVTNLLNELKNNGQIKKQYRLEKANFGGIGGVVIENKEATLRADFSIASFLEENKELVGRRIQAKLNEVMNVEPE